jgi:hypothetical protein
MNRQRLTAGVVLCALIACSNVLAQERRALLIGINEYLTEEFADLRGAVNDVEAMRGVLIDALDNLAREATADDMVYVHYSGHGSQVQDLNGDEQDSTDETILSHDARMEGIPDITDDEIGEFLLQLRADNAIIVLDSCHSGTATRGNLLTRSVPPDKRLDLYTRSNSDVVTRAVVPIDVPDQYILLTGAADNQSALDGPIMGKYRGFFSYALSEALNAVDADASPREIHDHVTQTFAQLSRQFGGLQLPEPQFEADPALLEGPMFRGAGASGNHAESPGGRAETVAALSQMKNPDTNLVVDARIVGLGRDHVMRIRRSGEPRSHQNSLMLEIEVSTGSYLTIIDVDTEGAVTVLFPNAYTNEGFLIDGFVPAETPVRIPDSLQQGNRAGFSWDYSPPSGVDTIQVFASTDLETANRIRSYIASLSSTAARGATGIPSYAAQLGELQRQLATDTRTRGVKVVRNQEVEVVAGSSAQSDEDASDWTSVSLEIRVED